MKDKTKKIALGAAIAAAVGYVAGILTAPKSGKQTRKDISEAASRALDIAEKRLKQLHSELNVLIDKAKKQSVKLQGKSRTVLDKALEAAQSAKEKAREALSILHEGGSSDKDLEKVIKEVSKAIDDLKTYFTKKEK